MPEQQSKPQDDSRQDPRPDVDDLIFNPDGSQVVSQR